MADVTVAIALLLLLVESRLMEDIVDIVKSPCSIQLVYADCDLREKRGLVELTNEEFREDNDEEEGSVGGAVYFNDNCGGNNSS